MQSSPKLTLRAETRPCVSGLSLVPFTRWASKLFGHPGWGRHSVALSCYLGAKLKLTCGIWGASQVALVVKNVPTNVGNMRLGCDPWVGKIPCRRAWQPTPVFLPGESYRQRNLVGCSPESRKESGMTERLKLAFEPHSLTFSFLPFPLLHHTTMFLIFVSEPFELAMRNVNCFSRQKETPISFPSRT